jgi:hypothetical protein
MVHLLLLSNKDKYISHYGCHVITLHYTIKINWTKAAHFFEDLSPHKISGPNTKWQQHNSHITNSHSSHDGIINIRK